MLNGRWPHGLSTWNWVREAFIIMGRAAIRHYANQARPLWPLRRRPNFTLRDHGVNDETDGSICGTNAEYLYNILHTNNVSVGNNFWIQSCWIHCKRQWPCVWKCTRRCISIDKTPLLTLCCQNVVVMIANFLRCVHQRHFLPGTGPGTIFLVEWQHGVSSLYGGGQKIWYDIFTQCIVHVQCISMHCKYTTHHDND